MVHGLRHHDRLLGMRDGRVHQHRIATQLHGNGGVGGRAYARVHQHRNLGFFEDDLQVVRVADTQAGTDQTGQRHHRNAADFCQLAGNDRVIAGVNHHVEAVRTCRLARELLDGHNLVKLEVLADQKTLFPNVIETLKAAETLVKEGFDVMVYTSDDPIIARQLAEIGCIAVMPLAGLIGSGLGICNPYNLQIILEEAKIPVLVDAGVGTASDATIAMELGCDAVLMNSAIAHAQQPIMMAEAMQHAIVAGRLAYLAGRMPKKLYASASSPLDGLIK